MVFSKVDKVIEKCLWSISRIFFRIIADCRQVAVIKTNSFTCGFREFSNSYLSLYFQNLGTSTFKEHVRHSLFNTFLKMPTVDYGDTGPKFFVCWYHVQTNKHSTSSSFDHFQYPRLFYLPPPHFASLYETQSWEYTPWMQLVSGFSKALFQFGDINGLFSKLVVTI